VTDPKDGELRQVPPRTPVIDLIERIPKIGKPVGKVLRAVRPFWRRRHEKRVQDEIDRRYHDKLRHGERDDTP
jgi:hypothetical protein